MFRKFSVVAVPIALLVLVGFTLTGPAGLLLRPLVGAEDETVLQPGDMVVVANESAELMVGKEVAAKLKKGAVMRISEVLGDWIGGRVVIDGEAHSGWLKTSAVQRVNATATKPTAKAASDEQPSTEPAKTEPAKTEPAKTEPAKTEPAKTEPAKTEPAKAEPSKTEPTKTEPAKTEPAKTEPAKTDARVQKPVAAKPAATSKPDAKPDERVDKLADRIAQIMAKKKEETAAKKSGTSTPGKSTGPSPSPKTGAGTTDVAKTEKQPTDASPAGSDQVSQEWSRILAEMRRARQMRQTDASKPAPADTAPSPPALSGSKPPVEKPADRKPATSDVAVKVDKRATGPATKPAKTASSAPGAPPAELLTAETAPVTPRRPLEAPTQKDGLSLVQLMIVREAEELDALKGAAHIGKLTITGSIFSNRDMSVLQGLSVRNLSLDASSLSSSALKYAAGVRNVRFMRLWTPRFTDSSLGYLSAFPDLEALDLEGSGIKGTSLASLKNLKRLSSLSLGALTEDSALDQLKEIRPLRELDLRACKRLTEESLNKIAQLQQLRVVWLPEQIARRGRNLLKRQMAGCEIRN